MKRLRNFFDGIRPRVVAFALPAALALGLSVAAADTAEGPKPSPAEEKRAQAMAPCAEGDDAAARAVACTALIAGGTLSGKDLGAAYVFRGEAQSARNEMKAAVGDFTQALKIDPRATDALYDRAAVYVLLNRSDLALMDYAQLLKVVPGDPDTHSRRALIYVEQGKLEAAVDDYSAVLKAAPDDLQSLLRRAGLLIALGRNQDAIGDLNRLLKKKPKQPEALYNRGRAEYLAGDYAAAAKDFEAAMQNRDQNPYAALRLTITRARAGKTDPQPLEATAKTFPPDQWPLPIVAFYQGKLSESDLLASAKANDPVSQANVTAEVQYYLGQWALLKGNADQARAHFTAARANAAAKADLEFIDAGLELKRLGAQ